MSDEPLNILIVDDNPVERMLLAGLLKKVRKWRVSTMACATGEEAMTQNIQCGVGGPDVVFVDYRLRGETGTDLIGKLREVGCEAGFILFTGTTGEEALLEALRTGADDYLHKSDLSIDNLNRVLRNTLEKRASGRALREAMAALRESKENLEVRVSERTAELRQAKEEAERATRLKDKFVSLVAHDLRGPFTTILGFLELLGKDKNNPLSKKQKVFLGWVVETSQRMLRMIDEILDISRIKTGKIAPKPRFINARFLSEQALDNITPLAVKKGIRIDNLLSEQVRLHADPSLLGEVLQNLLSNAVKFCRKGDRITIFQPDDEPTTLAVADTGVGIRKKDQDRIFHLEERVSTPGTAGEPGTGFGLPFSNELVLAHGGSLTFTSKEGKGSTFFIRLPLVSPRVLVVDDDTDFRQLLRQHLSREQVSVCEAGDGPTALGLLQEQEHHLVICDVQMPGMDGFEILKHMRENATTRTIPVILVTGDETIATREKAFQTGANDFVTKPFALHDFLPRVKRFLG